MMANISTISDADAFSIHINPRFDDSATDSSNGQSSFDDEYYKNKPSPLQINKSDIVIIRPTEVYDEEIEISFTDKVLETNTSKNGTKKRNNNGAKRRNENVTKKKNQTSMRTNKKGIKSHVRDTNIKDRSKKLKEDSQISSFIQYYFQHKQLPIKKTMSHEEPNGILSFHEGGGGPEFEALSLEKSMSSVSYDTEKNDSSKTCSIELEESQDNVGLVKSTNDNVLTDTECGKNELLEKYLINLPIDKRNLLEKYLKSKPTERCAIKMDYTVDTMDCNNENLSVHNSILSFKSDKTENCSANKRPVPLQVSQDNVGSIKPPDIEEIGRNFRYVGDENNSTESRTLQLHKEKDVTKRRTKAPITAYHKKINNQATKQDNSQKRNNENNKSKHDAEGANIYNSTLKISAAKEKNDLSDKYPLELQLPKDNLEYSAEMKHCLRVENNNVSAKSSHMSCAADDLSLLPDIDKNANKVYNQQIEKNSGEIHNQLDNFISKYFDNVPFPTPKSTIETKSFPYLSNHNDESCTETVLPMTTNIEQANLNEEVSDLPSATSIVKSNFEDLQTNITVEELRIFTNAMTVDIPDEQTIVRSVSIVDNCEDMKNTFDEYLGHTHRSIEINNSEVNSILKNKGDIQNDPENQSDDDSLNTNNKNINIMEQGKYETKTNSDELLTSEFWNSEYRYLLFGSDKEQQSFKEDSKNKFVVRNETEDGSNVIESIQIQPNLQTYSLPLQLGNNSQNLEASESGPSIPNEIQNLGLYEEENLDPFLLISKIDREVEVSSEQWNINLGDFITEINVSPFMGDKYSLKGPATSLHEKVGNAKMETVSPESNYSGSEVDISQYVKLFYGLFLFCVTIILVVMVPVTKTATGIFRISSDKNSTNQEESEAPNVTSQCQFLPSTSTSNQVNSTNKREEYTYQVNMSGNTLINNLDEFTHTEAFFYTFNSINVIEAINTVSINEQIARQPSVSSDSVILNMSEVSNVQEQLYQISTRNTYNYLDSNENLSYTICPIDDGNNIDINSIDSYISDENREYHQNTETERLFGVKKNCCTRFYNFLCCRRKGQNVPPIVT